jgi:hypothetical protein
MIEGKIANQAPKIRLNSGYPKPVCEKCQKLIDNPTTIYINVTIEKGDPDLRKAFFCYSYLETPNWIYESKSGSAVVYCSKYCRDKHNHRFNK